MKVNEQSLTSFSIELSNLADQSAKLSQREASSLKESLLDLFFSLTLVQIQLAELLSLEHGMYPDGSENENTSE